MKFFNCSVFIASTLMLFCFSACNQQDSALIGSENGVLNQISTNGGTVKTSVPSPNPLPTPISSPSPSPSLSPSPSPSLSPTPTVTPIQTPSPSPSPSPSVSPIVKRSWQTDVLLFAGDGTWGTEVNNLENIFNSNHITYREVLSSELNNMSIIDLSEFGAFVFPGGYGSTQANSLTANTHANLRIAVQQIGVGYVGFCAGSFIAVAPAPAQGHDVSYGLGIVNGPILDYYYLEDQGVDLAMTLESFPDGSTADIVWYGGPMTPNKGVIAKYPDGTPAISEMYSGKGLVVLSGVHPTASRSTLSGLGLVSSDGIHQDLALNLIKAAVQQSPLASFN